MILDFVMYSLVGLVFVLLLAVSLTGALIMEANDQRKENQL